MLAGATRAQRAWQPIVRTTAARGAVRSKELHCTWPAYAAAAAGAAALAAPARGISVAANPDAYVGQAVWRTHPELFASEDELTPGITRADYARRRSQLAARLPPGSALVLPSNPVALNIPYSQYRQETDFFYLCGFREPGSLLVLRADGEGGGARFALFVKGREPDRRLWEGPCASLDDARALFGAHEAHGSEAGSVGRELPRLLRGASRVYYRSGVNPALDAAVLPALAASGAEVSTAGAEALVQRQRLRKGPEELRLMRRAAGIAGAAFEAAMRGTRPGVSEAQVAARLEFECRTRGAQRLSYPPVVAGGPRGLSIHYVLNEQTLREGDTLLVDAGAEFWGYASDVTRVWPVSGRFTPAQRAVYDMMEDLQRSLLEHIAQRLGRGDSLTLSGLHATCIRLLCRGLVSLGIGGTRDPHQLFVSGGFFKYFPHAVSHFLGMDIHDCPSIPTKSTRIGPGVCFTVEPGVYLPLDDPDVPPEFRGVAVRIEDNVAVLPPAEGHGAQDEDPEAGGGPLQIEVLTAGIPKAAGEIEALVGRPLAER
eukprot:tig00021489_g21667.t1